MTRLLSRRPEAQLLGTIVAHPVADKTIQRNPDGLRRRLCNAIPAPHRPAPAFARLVRLTHRAEHRLPANNAYDTATLAHGGGGT